LFLAALLAAVSIGEAQSIIPQITDGGGWKTELVLTNTSSSVASVSLTFFQESPQGNAAGNTTSWNPPFIETVPTSIAAGATVLLHTTGTAANLSQGWAQVQGPATLSVYAIFEHAVPGRTNQDGTAVGAAGSTRILVPFDNTNGFTTSIAIANPTSSAESVLVGIETSGGAISQASAISLPAQGHLAFATSTQFTAAAAQSGTIEFYDASGSISVLALRFNSSGAFTTAPVYPQTGPPIIQSSSSSAAITIAGTAPSGNSSAINVAVSLPLSNGNFGAGSVTGTVTTGSTSSPFIANWSEVTVSGETLTFTGPLNVGSGIFATGSPAEFTSGTMSVTLSSTGAENGTVSGTIDLVSAVATISGTFTGTYTSLMAGI
jgi:hypothetical protein